MKSIAALIAVVLLVTGCGARSNGANDSAAGTKGGLAVTTSFNPDPPTQGSQMLTIAVKDASGAPAKGAVVKITSAMPSMSMNGPSITAMDNGDGTYTARFVLQYATNWTFDITASSDGKTGHAKVSKDVKSSTTLR